MAIRKKKCETNIASKKNKKCSQSEIIHLYKC